MSSIHDIALSMLNGINISTARELVRRMGSAQAVFSASESELENVLGRKGGIASAAVRADALRRAESESVFCSTYHVNAVAYTDPGYPARLAECDDAPALLYALGHTELNRMRTVAIVGTRHCTSYGAEFASQLVADIAKLYGNVAIISGLAYGIDVAAHRAALREGVPTVGVLANGLNTVYPAEHRDVAARMVAAGGMLVSEYPSSAKIHRGYFLARNRIVAGMADAVVIVESDLRGGAMATAHLASAYGRELFAVPGRVSDAYSRGCLELIASNEAVLLRSAADIGNALGWKPLPQEGEQQELALELTPEQRRVIEHIHKNPSHTVNDMVVHLGLPYAKLSAMLFELEMSDVIVTLPGGRFGVLNV